MISIPLPSKALELKVKVPRSSRYQLRHQIMAEETEPETSGGLRGDILIVFQTIILPVTFVITYIIATSDGHVEKKFPYISDTGTWPPESCIFGILLCFYSLSTLLTVYIRWHMMRQQHATSAASGGGGGGSPRLNNAALCLGLTAALGVLLVANFQVTSQIIVHMLGAMMAFYIGCVYMWLQTVLSWRLPGLPGFFKHILSIRIALASLTTISAILILPFGVIAHNEYHSNETKGHTPGSQKWDPDLGGNDMHIASTSFEWALAGLVSFFFLTFIGEFRHIRFGMPKIRHVTDPSNQATQFNEDTEKIRGIDNPVAVTME